VEFPFNRKSQRTANGFKLGKDEVSPFVLQATDIAEETEIIFVGFAFGDVLGQVGIRREKLGVRDFVGHVLLGVERRQAGAQLRCQQFHAILQFSLGIMVSLREA
jgi:hypothetical protein